MVVQGLGLSLAAGGLAASALPASKTGGRQQLVQRTASTVVLGRAETPSKVQINQVAVEGKRVFVRVDFNVMQEKKDPSAITTTQRIDAALPTINHDVDKGTKPVVRCAHPGRPGGRVVEKCSMASTAKVEQERLGRLRRC